MNVLVLGGTRFIGPHVVRQLVAAGHETALFNRGQSRPDISLPQGSGSSGATGGGWLTTANRFGPLPPMW
ncbi:hypothetical protein O3V59_12850 [Brevibacillus thermoruber]|jgi:nucleoside-diphosphate-sugar epimerase|uniref:NAD-dependent epimerase/dehydratase domain-containing protein n=1 Tax=Brevibacillus thermoruber TaxID=33942 RepID=A0A9X3TRX0_9BACL|nr:NAD-dependent epimerase/dehydratase family protein [Brevibacillus thermoruber]MDA5109254.1 hypothetical protein [Brevibacillus thermoruber]